MAREERVGTVTAYFAKIGVAAVSLTGGELRIGDHVRIHGHTTDLTQRVESLQLEHQSVQAAAQGTEIALKVRERVRPHDIVLRLLEDQA